MKLKSKLIIILSIIASAYGCSSSKNTGANKNVAGIYMPGLNLINPIYKILHKNDISMNYSQIKPYKNNKRAQR